MVATLSVGKATIDIPSDPWINARVRFCEGLSDDERKIFESTSLQTLFYSSSTAQRHHQENSRVRELSRKLNPLVEALNDYGQALDVFSNTFALYICLIWGAVRVILTILRGFEKYLTTIVGFLEHIGDILPRLTQYQALFANDQRLLQSLTDTHFVILQFCCEVKDTFLHPSRNASM